MPQSANPARDGVVTSFWWIRHAPVEPQFRSIVYGHTDVPAVTDDEPVFRGLARQVPKDAVWLTTPLMRTRQTRDAIAAAMDAPPPEPDVEPAFLEQDFGDWTGLTYAQLSEAKNGAYHRFWIAPAYHAPPNGESFAALFARVAEGIERRSESHRGRDVVVVAHGGSIRAAIGHALGLDPERMLALAVANLSLTRLDRYQTEKESVWRVTMMNAVPYTG